MLIQAITSAEPVGVTTPWVNARGIPKSAIRIPQFATAVAELCEALWGSAGGGDEAGPAAACGAGGERRGVRERQKKT